MVNVLYSRNLKWNPLIRWDGNIRGDLPQLNLLDVTGITHWKPDYEFLQLESLVEIRGASWNLDCNTCSLVKNYTIHRKYACTSLPEINKGECLTCPLTSCACTKYMYTNYTLLLAQRDFVYGKCNNTEQCYKSISRRKAANPCLSAGRNLFILQSVIGTIGLILNVIVIVIVLVTPKLRKNASMLLTCNMAFCDFLNCTYAILASFLYLSFPTEEFVAIKIQICPLVGSAWLLGQCGVAVTSAIMTFERHRAVAFATNPMMRLTLRQAIYAVMAAWFITGSILAYALLYKLFSYNSLCIPIAVSIDTPRLFGFSIFLCLLASVLYLFNVPLYIHIYIVVKKSSQRMRVRRESAVAKRIALLVVTNMAFFFLPIVIYGIMMTLGKIEAPAHTDWDKTNVLVFLIPVITPMYCLILNSCINPLLHAFRNETFREALKTWCCCWSPQHTAVVAVLQPQGSYKKSSSEETRNKQK